MDLRIQRTKSAIKQAFIELRREKPIEKITVTELTKYAEINKATFYLHYSDLYALTEEIEDGMIDEILSGINDLDKFIYNPRQYAEDIFRAFMNRAFELDYIFSGSRRAGFADRVERRIKLRLYREFPELESRHNDIVLSFLIQGIFHTCAESVPNCGAEDFAVISKLTAGAVAELQLPAMMKDNVPPDNFTVRQKDENFSA